MVLAIEALSLASLQHLNNNDVKRKIYVIPLPSPLQKKRQPRFKGKALAWERGRVKRANLKVKLNCFKSASSEFQRATLFLFDKKQFFIT